MKKEESEAIHESLIRSDRLRLMEAATRAQVAFQEMTSVMNMAGQTLVDLTEALRCAKATDERYGEVRDFSTHRSGS